jgi:RNA polymerase sigma-54 factor
VGPVLRQAIGFLEMSNADLALALKRDLEALPGITLNGDDGLVPERRASLMQHVRAEAGVLFANERSLRVAEAFIAALEPTGWLGAPVEAIAAEAEVPLPEAQAVFERLREVEPAGLFATSLADCLRLQAVDQNCLTPALEAVLANLSALERGVAALADASGLKVDDAAAALAILRSFDPKPGTRFNPPDPAIGRPHDLLADVTGRSVRVAFNPDTLPSLSLTAAAPARARRLAAMVERRNTLVLCIATIAAERQGAWLAGKRDTLATLRHREVALAAEAHESTVSRIAAALTMKTPRGVLPLRHLFNKHGTLRDAIDQAIMAEDRARPLSDAALAHVLRAQGHAVARRSVARHRKALGHPTASRRVNRA